MSWFRNIADFWPAGEPLTAARAVVGVRPLLSCLVALLLTCALATTVTAANAVLPGEAIYRQGILPAGEALHAEREGGIHVSGEAAACVNCHRRSGLGMREGRRTIPPVAGSYLFHPRAGPTDALDLPFVEGMRGDRDPYTAETLARAIRSGVGADGKALSYLMPHYTIGDAEMAQLIDYLKSLSPGDVPGVTPQVLHFATIITPDADPVRRRGMLDVLDKFFADKNHYTRSESPRLRSSRRMMFKVSRHWQLHVWELRGTEDTWEQQLREKLAAEPVFAVLSGLGGTNWLPIHHFCEEQALPCLFPNLDVPVVAEEEFDNLYLSQGVVLEARLVAARLRERSGQAAPRRVIQIFRTADAGRAGADALAKALAGTATTVVNHALDAGAHERELRAAVRKAGAGDVLVLWLRPQDVARLAAPPPGVDAVFLSGRMAGLERAPLPTSWRAATHLTYPFELPERRRTGVDFALGWFRIRQIPIVAEQVQADTYLACGLVSDAINHMVDTFVRDYLVERLEEMLEHRVITGYYPRLALAPGQRFASKGGYFVHFAGDAGPGLVAEGGWIVP